MTKRSRRIFFWLLVILFAALTPAIIGYSLGYRIDWEAKKIVATGSLFIKAKPNQAAVLLNGKLEKETSFLWGTALISNLKPKNYLVSVEKDGYWKWSKNLAVSPELVTEARNVILFPKETPPEKILDGGVSAFWPFPGVSKIAYNSEENGFWFYDLKTGVKINAEEMDACGKEIADCEIIFSADGNKLLVHKINENSWRLAEIDWDGKTAVFYPIFQKPYQTKNKKTESLPVKTPVFNPKNSNEIFYAESGAIYSYDIEKGAVKKITAADENVLGFAVAEQYVYFATAAAGQTALSEVETTQIKKHPEFEINLYEMSATGNQKTKINSLPLAIEQIRTKEPLKIAVSGESKIALQIGASLYVLDGETKNFTLVSDSAENAVFSPDGKKLLYSGEKEISVYYLEKILIQPYKKIGEKNRLVSPPEILKNALWLSDSEHIIFWENDKIKIAELDDRDKVNVVEFLAAAPPAGGAPFFYDAASSEIYFLDKGILFKTSL